MAAPRSLEPGQRNVGREASRIGSNTRPDYGSFDRAAQAPEHVRRRNPCPQYPGLAARREVANALELKLKARQMDLVERFGNILKNRASHLADEP